MAVIIGFDSTICYLFIYQKQENDVRSVPSYIETLQPYKAGKPIDEVPRELGLNHVIKLASNENPLGISPRAIDAMNR